VKERAFVIGFSYHGFIDAAGGSGSDSYTLGIAHKQGDRVLMDAMREVRPPFSPVDVTADFAKLLRSYRIVSVRGDRYGGRWVSDAFREHGIGFRPCDQNKSEIYADFLPLLNTGQVVLLDDKRCVGQIAALERRVRFGGRSASIDHPTKGHDDLANVAAGAVVHAQRSRGVPRDMRASEPNVILGYAKQKREAWRGKQHPASISQNNGVTGMSIKHEIQAAAEAEEPKRHLVGDKGHFLVLHERGNDGREKWAIHNPAGETQGFIWGRGAAEAAIKQLIEEGVISR
jgi:hypothetical protein